MSRYFRPLLLAPLFAVLIGFGVLQAAPGQQKNVPPPKIDINSAMERDLMTLPDITFPLVRKIIANRPYTNTHELVSKGIISEPTYNRIRDLITVKEPVAPRRIALPGL